MGLRFLADQLTLTWSTIRVNYFWWKSIESEFVSEHSECQTNLKFGLV